ncbi:MAG: flagellar assembly protein FliW [Clostridia bacterium]|jgi:flagellar assembly factor FliW|nr:flagellar assembly protein FliW [Clostridia bacterium]
MNMSENSALKAKKAARIIISFQEGLYGFEDVKDYILLQEDEAKTIWSLQAAYSDVPSFVVINPFMVLKDYSPILSHKDLKSLGMPNEEEICFLAVTVLKEKIEESVANLKSPIVINVRTRQAKQIILENNNYPIRCKLFPNLK